MQRSRYLQTCRWEGVPSNAHRQLPPIDLARVQGLSPQGWCWPLGGWGDDRARCAHSGAELLSHQRSRNRVASDDCDLRCYYASLCCTTTYADHRPILGRRRTVAGGLDRGQRLRIRNARDRNDIRCHRINTCNFGGHQLGDGTPLLAVGADLLASSGTLAAPSPVARSVSRASERLPDAGEHASCFTGESRQPLAPHCGLRRVPDPCPPLDRANACCLPIVEPPCVSQSSVTSTATSKR